MPPAAAFCFRRGKMTDRGAYSARAACSNSGGFPGFRVYYAARPRAADRANFPPGSMPGGAAVRRVLPFKSQVEINANNMTLRNRFGEAQSDRPGATAAVENHRVRTKVRYQEIRVDVRAAQLYRSV